MSSAANVSVTGKGLKDIFLFNQVEKAVAKEKIPHFDDEQFLFCTMFPTMSATNASASGKGLKETSHFVPQHRLWRSNKDFRT